MKGTFANEVAALTREALALIQEKKKSMATLSTLETSVSLSFDMELLEALGTYEVTSKKMARVSISSDDETALIGISYNISSLNRRMIQDDPGYDSSSGAMQRLVVIESYNNDDLATLQGGGSVTLEYEMVVTSTAPVTVSVSYEDYR